MEAIKKEVGVAIKKKITETLRVPRTKKVWNTCIRYKKLEIYTSVLYISQ